MEIRLSSISTISARGTVETVVSHNHPGRLREPGECPACDQFHDFYAFAAE